MQITSDIELSGAGCTTAITPNQLVQSSSENDIWYRPDIFQIATEKDLKNPIPFMMYADSASQKFDAQFPNNTRWQPNNNHAQYALFWFSLAGALIVIYVLRFLKKK